MRDRPILPGFHPPRPHHRLPSARRAGESGAPFSSFIPPGRTRLPPAAQNGPRAAPAVSVVTPPLPGAAPAAEGPKWGVRPQSPKRGPPRHRASPISDASPPPRTCSRFPAPTAANRRPRPLSPLCGCAGTQADAVLAPRRKRRGAEGSKFPGCPPRNLP